MTEDDARSFVAARGNSAALQKLDRFVAELLDEADRQNLIARATRDVIWSRHIADSAQLVDHLPTDDGPIVDFGAGAGLPGIVLATLRPATQVVLIESRKLRVAWLERAADDLKLSNVRVIGASVQQVAAFPAAAITARAFAALAPLLQLASPFSTQNTVWVLPKGKNGAQELEMLPARQRAMFHVKQSMTDPASSILVGKGRIGAK